MMNKTLLKNKSLVYLLIICLLSISTTIQAQQEADGVLKITLDEAIKIAKSENPTIKVADKEIELKKESKKEAISNLFPDASLVGSYSRTIKKQTMAMSIGGTQQTIEVGTDNSYSGGLQVNLPLFVPALYKTINLSKTDVELAVEKSRESTLNLVNQVVKAYYQLLLAQDSYNVLLKSYKQAEDNYRIVNAKFTQGKVSEYDKIRANVQVQTLKPSVVSAKNGVNLASLQLKVLMGISNDLTIQIEGNLKDYETMMFSAQMTRNTDLVQNNSSLRQLDLNAKMLNDNLKLQYTNFMPSLSATFNYMYTSLNNDFKIAHYDWYPYSTVALNLSIPLFKASNYSKVKQTKIQISQLEQNKINTERQLRMQAKSYQDNMNASAETVVSNKENIYQAEKGRTIAQKRYEIGKGTILELNDAEVALTQAQLTYNQSIFDYLTAKADLDTILGEEYIQEINNDK